MKAQESLDSADLLTMRATSTEWADLLPGVLAGFELTTPDFGSALATLWYRFIALVIFCTVVTVVVTLIVLAYEKRKARTSRLPVRIIKSETEDSWIAPPEGPPTICSPGQRTGASPKT